MPPPPLPLLAASSSHPSWLALAVYAFSPGPHKWQKLHATSFAQPFVCKKAQGLQRRSACPADPILGSSAVPGAGLRGGGGGTGAPQLSTEVAVGLASGNRGETWSAKRTRSIPRLDGEFREPGTGAHDLPCGPLGTVVRSCVEAGGNLEDAEVLPENDDESSTGLDGVEAEPFVPELRGVSNGVTSLATVEASSSSTGTLLSFIGREHDDRGMSEAKRPNADGQDLVRRWPRGSSSTDAKPSMNVFLTTTATCLSSRGQRAQLLLPERRSSAIMVIVLGDALIPTAQKAPAVIPWSSRTILPETQTTTKMSATTTKWN